MGKILLSEISNIHEGSEGVLNGVNFNEETVGFGSLVESYTADGCYATDVVFTDRDNRTFQNTEAAEFFQVAAARALISHAIDSCLENQ